MDGPTPLPRTARAEAALALAMLPVGVGLGLLSALGAAALLLSVLPAIFMSLAGTLIWWAPLWCFCGGVALGWATVRSVEVVSAFDWRPLPGIMAVQVLTFLSMPFWR